jgi:hypothetical protein
MILFSYLTDFNYFPLKIVSRNLLDQNKSKMTILKGVVDGFMVQQVSGNNFQRKIVEISLITEKNHPCYMV